jgi:hypothetical protein
MATTFRHVAGFGRRMEYWLIGKMLRENLDVYVPLVDDFGIDAVIRKAGNSFIEVQIKARSHNVKFGSAGLFAAIHHPEPRESYYFVFHSERLDSTWILSSDELIAESNQIRNGPNKGLRAIWFNGTKIDKTTGKKTEYAKPRYDKYLDPQFDRFRAAGALTVASK